MTDSFGIVADESLSEGGTKAERTAAFFIMTVVVWRRLWKVNPDSKRDPKWTGTGRAKPRMVSTGPGVSCRRKLRNRKPGEWLLSFAN